MVVHSVISGMLKGVGKDSGTSRLILKNNHAYDYFDIPEEILDKFYPNFDGKVYNEHIRGKHSEKKVTDFV